MADKQALSNQLLDIIRTMEEEGFVDSRFRMVYSLKEANGPFFFAELIPTFCSDAQITITQMTLALEQPVLNFYDLEELCMKIKGGTSCIGAQQMALACGDLRQAIDDKSKERCIVAVDAIKHEYIKLQSKMDIVLQLPDHFYQLKAPIKFHKSRKAKTTLLERRIISHD